MSEHFPPGSRSIRLVALVRGPVREIAARMLLDTGATRTILAWELALACGYDPGGAKDRIEITTASGFESCPEVTISEFLFLGLCRRNFSVLCHPLPSELRIDGVVGLDFLRDTKLTIDFRIGEVMVEI
jgi:predicted aspartyl protease